MTDAMTSFSGTGRPLYEVKANLFKGLSHPVRVRVPLTGPLEGALIARLL